MSTTLELSPRNRVAMPDEVHLLDDDELSEAAAAAPAASSARPVGARRWSPSYLLGLSFIFVVALLWAGASVLVQYIYNNLHFSEPFTLTYLCTSLFSVYLPLWATLVRLRVVTDPPWRTPPQRAAGTARAGEADDADDEEDDAAKLTAAAAADKPAPLSHGQTARVSAFICPLWFLANWSYNASLSMTSVTSSTIIATTSSLFTFGFGVVVGTEEYTSIKLLGVGLCIGGTVLVALDDEEKGADDDTTRASLAGDAVCFASAAFYAAYTTAIRYMLPDDERASMQLVFGYLGLFNAVALLPVLLVAGAVAPATWDGLTLQVLGWIALKGIFDNVLSDYLWARSVVLTTPTVATVGLSLTVPLAFASDFVLGHGAPDFLSTLGAFGVIGGFVLCNLSPETVGSCRDAVVARLLPHRAAA